MKFPTNSITVNKSIEDAFSLLLHPDTYSSLLKAEYGAKIIHDKKLPMETGKTVKLIMPSDKGQFISELVLGECMPPSVFRYDISSVYRKKNNKEEPIPLFVLVDRLSFEVRFSEIPNGTKVIFSTYAVGLNGLLTKAFAYLFFGLPSWFENRKYLKQLTEVVDSNA